MTVYNERHCTYSLIPKRCYTLNIRSQNACNLNQRPSVTLTADTRNIKFIFYALKILLKITWNFNLRLSKETNIHQSPSQPSPWYSCSVTSLYQQKKERDKTKTKQESRLGNYDIPVKQFFYLSKWKWESFTNGKKQKQKRTKKKNPLPKIDSK